MPLRSNKPTVHLVLEKEGQGLFSDEPPELCRTTPDPARLEAALATAELAEELAAADRNRPTSTLLRY
jgi:hypothetical protein